MVGNVYGKGCVAYTNCDMLVMTMMASWYQCTKSMVSVVMATKGQFWTMFNIWQTFFGFCKEKSSLNYGQSTMKSLL